MRFICDEKLFFSKNDPQDPRLGDFAKSFTKVSLSNITFHDSFTLLGYPDDEGIKLNGGRPGAALAPSSIRKNFYKCTPSLSFTKKDLALYDFGDLEISGDLKSRHAFASETVSSLLKKNINVMTIGGGHDYGFSDFDAFVTHALKIGKKPFVVNFDAHLDVRPDTKGEHSGTPFFRLLSKYDAKTLDFYEVGIQEWCNSPAHLNWAHDRGAKVLSLKEFQSTGLSFSEFMNENVWKNVTPDHVVGLSVDIDFFQSAFAPGASQVFPIGINPNEFMPSWQRAINSFKPQMVSIYEVSPPLDVDDRTSKLAALLLHQFIFAR